MGVEDYISLVLVGERDPRDILVGKIGPLSKQDIYQLRLTYLPKNCTNPDDYELYTKIITRREALYIGEINGCKFHPKPIPFMDFSQELDIGPEISETISRYLFPSPPKECPLKEYSPLHALIEIISICISPENHLPKAK
jgi:hypothetical protein